ncbi:MAG: murein biosynthesis integral membrane protein MurJ [Aquificae bacterium]|nr:murein biosynthesis integral membrane protein MurJ [Aquificota bacterium]
MAAFAAKFFRASSAVLLSRLLGFLREVLTAALFGAGALTDAFFLAWKVPNLFRRVLGEGAVEKVLLPSLGRKADPNYLSAVLFWLLFLSLVVAAALALLSEEVISVLAPFAPPETVEAAALMLKPLAFYLPLISVAAFFGALLQHGEHFFKAYFHQAVFNAAAVALLLLLSPHLGVYALVWAVLLAGVLQTLYAAAAAKRAGLFVWPRPSLGTRVKRFFKNLVPSFFSAGVGQVAVLAEAFFATAAGSGVLSALYYAQRLYFLPVSLVGIAAGRVNLSELAKAEPERFFEKLAEASAAATKLVVPLTIASLVAAESAVKLVYERGNFGPSDAAEVALYLKLYSLGLPAAVLLPLVSNLYYAKGAFYRLFFLTLVWPAVEVLLSAVGVFYLRLGGAAVAAAHSLGAWSALLLLLWDRRLFDLPKEVWRRTRRLLPLWGAEALTLLWAAENFGQGTETFLTATAWGLYFLWDLRRERKKGA